MVSLTQQTCSIRRRKKTNQGKRRKRMLRSRGSTPKFPLLPEGQAAAKTATAPKTATAAAKTATAPKTGK